MSLFGKWFQKTCERLDVAILHSTHVGLKCVNPPPYSERLAGLAGSEVFELAADKLHLSLDALKDDCTLLGVPITESPHLALMRLFNVNADAESSDYVRRLRAGTLDFRPARRVKPKHLAERREKFLAARVQLESGRQEPVIVIRLAGAHFIADGKHRAAVGALLGQPVRCVEATAAAQYSLFWWIRRKMEKTPAPYQKHLRWFEALATQKTARR